ncbi:MAG: hypothetical protein ABWY07_05370 [Burkholderiales bacterium]
MRFRLWAPGASRVELELGDTTYPPSLRCLRLAKAGSRS